MAQMVAVVFSADPAHFALFLPPDAKAPVLPKGARLTTVAEYPVPSDDDLAFARGVDAKAVVASKLVVVWDTAVTKPHEVELYELAKATGAALWDDDVRDLQSADVWRKRRVESWNGELPYVGMHTTISVIDDAPTAITRGLKHFGLPELEAGGCVKGSLRTLASLLNALGQRLVEAPALAKPGRLVLALDDVKHEELRVDQVKSCFPNAAKRVELSVSKGAEGRLRIDVPGEGTVAERWERAFTALYGSHDEPEHLQHDDELLATSKAAVKKLRDVVKPRFLRGLGGAQLLVKAPFKMAHADGNEWMWVEVQSWKKDGTLKGLLDNDPEDVPGLHSGSTVTVKEGELFDWVLHEEDGGFSGNATGALMLKRQGKTLPY